MKILYAVQATGNGHISRAKELIPYLSEYGNVDVFLSGSNSQLATDDLNIKYRSHGLSLFYNQEKGGLDYYRIGKEAHFKQCFKEAKKLPVEKYDWVINDFEFITSLACRIKGVKSTGMGHQASFYSKKVPKHFSINPVGRFILKNYAPADAYVGFHFKGYDYGIFPPIIRRDVKYAAPENKGHITVYLPQYEYSNLTLPLFYELTDYRFEIFTDVANEYTSYNVSLYPITTEEFTKSMIGCAGLITAGGFETPAEALYLGKKLMCIPIKGQYEQMCNAEALNKDFGVPVIYNGLTADFKYKFWEWMEFKKYPKKIFAADPTEVIKYAINNRI